MASNTQTAPRGVSPRAASILGLDPATAPERAATEALVRAGAYFSLFSLPNPASPNQATPLVPVLGEALAIGFEVSEALHRFEVEEWAPTPACGLRLRQVRSESEEARVGLNMTPMPNYFEADPSRTPPPTILLPFLSQRFEPRDGSIEFFDAEQSGLSAEGAGRTFPTGTGLSARLIAVLNAIETHGRLSGLPVTGIVSGDIVPPLDFAFSVLFRAVDPEGRFRPTVPPGPIPRPSDPTPQTNTKQGTSFIQVLSEEDPDHPITVATDADGQTVRVTITEKLRLVELNFNVDSPGLRSSTRVGQVVGRHRTTLVINLAQSADVLAAYSKGDEFSFFDTEGRSIGGFTADTVEARLMPTVEAGGAMIRIGGMALPTAGTGQFTDPLGQVSINGAFSPVSGTASTLYIIRLTVPDAVFKVVA